MAGPSLRRGIFADPFLTPEVDAAIEASSMGSLRRGYESGRIGTDINANLARESSLRAAGDMTAADALRAQTEGLQRRSSIYAPAVQRVEDIDGIGSGASWLAGQIGSGAASMQDPVLASAALSAAGTGLSFAPHPLAKLAGAGLRNLAAPLAAYDINRRQLKGEQYGNLSADPTVMGQFTPQEIDDQAGTYGMVAGLIDSALPAMVGRQLGGAALRARPKMGPATSAPLGLAGEGLTEVVQGEGGRLQHEMLNPNRDASGDASLRLNEFLGGAAGATGPVAADAAAQGLYGAARAVPGAVKDAAGTVVDMASPYVDAAKEKAAPYVDAAKEKATGFAEAAKDGVIDMKARFQAGREQPGLTPDDVEFMFGMPKDVDANDPQAFAKWHTENFPARVEKVSGELARMAAEGDPKAAELATGLQAGDPVDLENAVQAGAAHIVERQGVQELAKEAEQSLAARGGAMAGKVAGKVAGAAMDAGKAALGAFKGRKLNAQDAGAPAWTGDEYEQRRSEAMGAFDEAAKRADLMSEHLGAQADVQGARYGEKGKNIPGYMREMGRQIADLAENWKGGDAKPTAGKFDRLRYDLNRMAGRLHAAYGPSAQQVVADLEGMADPKAKPLFGHLREELAVVSGKGGASRTMGMEQQAYDGMLKGIDQGRQAELLREGIDLRAPRTRQQVVRMIEAAASGQLKPSERDQLNELLGPNNLRRAIQSFSPRTAEQDAVESAYETSKASNLVTDENGNVTTADEAAGQDEEGQSDFEKRQGQKLMDQRAGASVYSMQGLKPRADRTLSGKQTDLLKFTKDFSPRLYDLRTNEGTPEEQEKRKGLLKKAEDDLTRHLGGDKSWTVETRSALEDMARREGVSLQTLLGPYAGRNKVTETEGKKLNPDETAERLGVNSAFVNKVITRYRDFMLSEVQRAGGADLDSGEPNPKAAPFLTRARNADAVLRDRLRQSRMGDKAVLKTEPGQREDILKRAVAYLSNFGVVVAERATNRDPEQISADQVLALAERGKSLRAASAESGANKNDLLMFESKLAPARPNGDLGMLYVRASDLVKFARKARQEQSKDATSKNANEQYLADLSTGLSALVANGHVEGMPRGFEEGKIPDTLPLATTTYGKWEYRKKQDAKNNQMVADGPGDARAGKRAQEAIATDQEHNFFVPDDTPAEAGGRRFVDDAQSHMIETRTHGRAVTSAPLTASKAQLDAESLAAVRSTLERKRANFIKGGATETGPRIRAIDAELARLAEQEGRREPDTPKVKDLPAPVQKPVATAAPQEGAAPVGKLSARPSGAAKRKLNAQATQLHNELGRTGFGATHDSPHRHEGKFDWRKHALKGEGAFAFGAGTYLSTGDGVHKFYKKAFTAEVRKEQATPWRIDGIKGTSILDGDYGYLHEADGGVKLNRGQSQVIQNILDFGLSAKEAIEQSKEDLNQFLEKQSTDLQLAHGNALGKIADYLARKEPIPENLDSPAVKRMMSIERWNKNVASVQGKLAELDAIDPTSVHARATKSPTYQVSVDIPPERLLDWDKPLSEQGATVRLRATKTIKEHGLDLGDPTGKQLYEALAKKLAPSDSPKDKLQGQFAASDYLQSLGILGHFYAASNGTQGKAPNYVIYDDSKITTNFVAFSQQNPSNKVVTQAEMDEAREYVTKVLGPRIKVDFKALTGYSGEWIEAQNAIEISTTPGPGAMQVAYHEALHAFFSKFVENNPQALQAFQALVDDKKIMARVEALLAGHPNALAQLVDGEERLAYIYQFWAAGLLDLPTKKAGIFEAIREFFRKVFGLVKDSERATAILEAFHAGKMTEPSAAGEVITKALAEGTWTTKQLRKVDGLVAKVQSLTLPTQMVLANSDSATARELATRIWTNPGDEEHGDKGEGYINAKAAVATKYVNLFSGYIKGMTDRDLVQLAKYMQDQTELADIPFAPHREAVQNMRALLGRFYKYMRDEKGMDIGKIDDGKYFPRVWDVGQLLAKEKEFIAMMKANYPDDDAEAIHAALVKNCTLGMEVLPSRTDGVLSPFYSADHKRDFKWMKPEHVEPFLNKDLIGTMTSYFHAGARAAEYGARFGQKGEVLESMLDKVRQELLVAGQARFDRGEFKTAKAAKEWALRRHDQVAKAVGAVEGTLGSDVGSTWRNVNTWTTVYQNVRLLPLALFSSVVDPLGMVARGADMSEAYSTFLRGMREVFTGWKDLFSKERTERTADKWEELAMAAGSVDAAMFSRHVADEYSSMYMSKTAKKVNDTFFQLNGMEAWNRGVRVGATQAAVNFLQKHAQKPGPHSERWLKELGLTASDLSFDKDGGLVTDKKSLAALKGISITEAEKEIEKTHYAIRRWVQGAVLTPNAAQRPAWSSDPHYSMFFHLKQFSYSFHQTILKRAVNEAGHGNIAPLGAFAWYIPVMIAADVTKGLLQGGGELPPHMKGMDLGDWMMHATNRAGLLGVAAIGVDAQNDIASVAGPAVEQLADSFNQSVGRTIVDALPAKPLVAGAFR